MESIHVISGAQKLSAGAVRDGHATPVNCSAAFQRRRAASMSYAGCGSFDNTGSPLSCPLPRPELEGDEHGGDPIGYDAASGERRRRREPLLTGTLDSFACA